jgi:molecular chaperone GrpE
MHLNYLYTINEDPMTEPAEAPQEPVDNTQESAQEVNVVETLNAEIASLKDKLLRAVAETDNVRKRAQRDVEETSKYAVTPLAKDLVNVCENLNRALECIPADQRDANPLLKSLGDGVEMTLKELLAIFQRNGIRRIEPLGEKFDHNFHQAVMQVQSPDHEAGTVVQVLQAGYVIHDRLLRPAMVGVAKQGEAPKKVDTSA